MPIDPGHLFHALLHIDQTIAMAGASHGAGVYLILFGIIFCELAFLPLFFLPGDPLLFVCGAFCAAGIMQIWILIPVLLVATVAGSVVNYLIGRALGKRLYAGGVGWINRKALDRTHAFYATRGRQTFLLSPFIAVVRTFAPFVAGISGMALRPFALAVCGGALLWIVGLLGAGYFFGNVPLVREHVGAITLLGLGVAILVMAAAQLRKLFRAPS
ncbi:membrane-associated protein [Actimicrobium sp. GrIS 1.19]|uniref:VTT domain-containing protein n=1 Tax=Actimicrobium sp. GrIS 1.19 TaxID=3071708 RepID=UPI002E00AA62|nr:membrane-associated protein [Actimicrobium sp. GrIS 1.19]